MPGSEEKRLDRQGVALPIKSQQQYSLFAELLSSGHETSQTINGNRRPTTGPLSELHVRALDGFFGWSFLRNSRLAFRGGQPTSPQQH
jgi:hypothetical protein